MGRGVSGRVAETGVEYIYNKSSKSNGNGKGKFTSTRIRDALNECGCISSTGSKKIKNPKSILCFPVFEKQQHTQTQTQTQTQTISNTKNKIKNNNNKEFYATGGGGGSNLNTSTEQVENNNTGSRKIIGTILLISFNNECTKEQQHLLKWLSERVSSLVFGSSRINRPSGLKKTMYLGW